MEINKSIFGNTTIDKIPVPSKKIRQNMRTGKKEIHFYTLSEYINYFKTGRLEIGEDAEWIEIN